MFDFYIEIENDSGMFTQEVMMKSFKKSLIFFTNPVKNGIGKTIIERMQSRGLKYLVPDIYTDAQLHTLTGRFL